MTKWKFAVYQTYEDEKIWGSKKRHVRNHRTLEAAEKYARQLNNRFKGCTYIIEEVR